jgi:hypothetical protein
MSERSGDLHAVCLARLPAVCFGGFIRLWKIPLVEDAARGAGHGELHSTQFAHIIIAGLWYNKGAESRNNHNKPIISAL